MVIKEFEEILRDRILVDCKDLYEQNMSWYYYVQDEIDFPFKAKIELLMRDGRKILKEVEAISYFQMNPISYTILT